MLQVFKNLLVNKRSYKQQGITLVEALLATALLGIGFAGVYTITALSAESMSQSVARQKMQMQANQILDLIETDTANIDQYVLNLANCAAPLGGQTEKYQLRPFEWCSRLNGEVGSALANDIRSVNITTLADGRKVAHVLLESHNGNVQVVMKRIFDDGN